MIDKETKDLSNTVGQIYLIDMYGTFYPTAAEYTFFSNVHETFFKIDHTLGHKTSLNNFEKTEIISSIFTDQYGIKLKINGRKKTGKLTSMWSLTTYSWYHGVKEEIKRGITKYLELNDFKAGNRHDQIFILELSLAVLDAARFTSFRGYIRKG